MRSVEEVKKRIDKKEKNDIFRTYIDLVEFLPEKDAKEFLRPEDGYTDVEAFGLKEYTRENVIKEIKDYLEFAYGKAEGARGISSGRSIMHFTHWLWLLEDHELLAYAEDDDNYPMYGFPILQKIAGKYAPEMKKEYNQIKDRTGDPVYD